ncbi:hypothetical protein ACD661_15110 [Legionella lytica]|uniref:DUF975 family protein n=1 Tax=Legionella lytica TaxID=96232 RepID=A0ABW8DEF0_9GAMM
MSILNTNQQKIHGQIMYKKAWQLLSEKKCLFLFSVLGSLVLFITALSLLYFTHVLIQYISSPIITELQLQKAYTSIEIIFKILFLLLTYFIGIFILFTTNSAIILCTQELINNRRFSINQLFFTLYMRKLKIFQWAIFFGLIGLLINILEFLSDTITNFIISFIGFSFYSLSWMVVPIILEKNLSPTEAIYEAKDLLVHGLWQNRFFIRNWYLGWRLWIGQMLFMGLFFFTFSSHFPERYKTITMVIALVGGAFFILLQSLLYTILKVMAYEYITNPSFNKKIHQSENFT